MVLPITALVTGILVCWYVVLAIQTSLARLRHNVPLGLPAEQHEVVRTARTHGNMGEYLALFLVVFGLLEFHGLREEVLYVLAGLFIVGRFLHYRALQRSSFTLRMWAVQCNHWALLIGAVILLYTWFVHAILL